MGQDRSPASSLREALSVLICVSTVLKTTAVLMEPRAKAQTPSLPSLPASRWLWRMQLQGGLLSRPAQAAAAAFKEELGILVTGIGGHSGQSSGGEGRGTGR